MRITSTQECILRTAIKQFGEQAQIDQAIGKIGEFLTLFGREAQGRATGEMWADEIADAVIMLRQVAMIKGISGMVQNRIDYKINQLAERLGK